MPLTIRPDDRDALRAAVREMHARSGLEVGFGGLVPRTGRTAVRLDELLGVQTAHLRHLEVRAGAGLGGRVLAECRPASVDDYRDARGITHDYDGPVLAEGLCTVAAVPVLVGGAPRAVLYAASRERGSVGDRVRDAMASAATRMAVELAIRDEVDRRVALLVDTTAQATSARAGGRRSGPCTPSCACSPRTTTDEVRPRPVADRLRPAGLAQRRRPAGRRGRTVRLSARELDVLALVALGCSNREARDPAVAAAGDGEELPRRGDGQARRAHPAGGGGPGPPARPAALTVRRASGQQVGQRRGDVPDRADHPRLAAAAGGQRPGRRLGLGGRQRAEHVQPVDAGQRRLRRRRRWCAGSPRAGRRPARRRPADSSSTRAARSAAARSVTPCPRSATSCRTTSSAAGRRACPAAPPRRRRPKVSTRGLQPLVRGAAPRRPRRPRRSRPPSPVIDPELSTSQADRPPVPGPAAGDQVLGRDRRPGAGPPVEGAVQVEVAVAAALGDQPPGAPGRGSGRPGPPGRTPGPPAAAPPRAGPGRWPAPGRSAARPRRRGRRPAARANASSSSSPDLRADLVERLVPGGQLAAADLARGRRRRGGPGAGRSAESGPAGGGPSAFPRPSAAGRPVGVLLLRRRRALRPDRVEDLVDDRLRRAVDALGDPDPARTARRARRPGSSPGPPARPGPRRRAPRSRPSSSSTRSIAPRTDEPIRTSRCSRVARTSRDGQPDQLAAGRRSPRRRWPARRPRPGSRAPPGTSGRRWPGRPGPCRSASNGFIAAISRNPAAARTCPSRGTVISPSVSTVMRTLRVSSGIRLSSSR